MRSRCSLGSLERAFLTVAIAAVLVGTSACGSGAAQLTESDSGDEVTIGVGKELQVELESNPSTGYSWLVSELDSEILSQEGEPSFEPADDEETVGAPGREIFHFKGASAGETTLRMEYVRPWELEEPEREFEVTVKVE